VVEADVVRRGAVAESGEGPPLGVEPRVGLSRVDLRLEAGREQPVPQRPDLVSHRVALVQGPDELVRASRALAGHG
jgi:hypothetical protein